MKNPVEPVLIWDTYNIEGKIVAKYFILEPNRVYYIGRPEDYLANGDICYTCVYIYDDNRIIMNMMLGIRKYISRKHLKILYLKDNNIIFISNEGHKGAGVPFPSYINGKQLHRNASTPLSISSLVGKLVPIRLTQRWGPTIYLTAAVEKTIYLDIFEDQQLSLPRSIATIIQQQSRGRALITDKSSGESYETALIWTGGYEEIEDAIRIGELRLVVRTYSHKEIIRVLNRLASLIHSIQKELLKSGYPSTDYLKRRASELRRIVSELEQITARGNQEISNLISIINKIIHSIELGVLNKNLRERILLALEEIDNNINELISRW